MILKKGNQVKIITGKDKGKTGEILEIDRKLNKIKIKSISMIKRHTKPTKENKGGIISKESFIHLSNVKNVDMKKEKKVLTLKKDLFNIRFKKVNNQINNPAQYNEIKKSIARLYTQIKNSKWQKKY